MSLRKFFFLFALVILACENSFGQHSFIGLYSQTGRVLPTNAFTKGQTSGKKLGALSALTFRFGKQTNGSKSWQQEHGYPALGYGITFYNLGENKYLGAGVSVFGFYRTPICSFGSCTLANDASYGLAYFQHHWTWTNQENIAISLPISLYLQEALILNYKFKKHWKASLSAGFFHFSNGAVQKPNIGINNIFLGLGITRNLYDTITYIHSTKPEFKDKFHFLTSIYGSHDVLFYGLSNEKDPQKKYTRHWYGNCELSFTALRCFNPKHALGLSLGVMYQDNTAAHYSFNGTQMQVKKASVINRFATNSTLSYQYTIKNIDIIVEEGLWLLKKQDNEQSMYPKPKVFQDIGFRYNIGNYFFSVRLRAFDYHVANYLQFGLGYRVKTPNICG